MHSLLLGPSIKQIVGFWWYVFLSLLLAFLSRYHANKIGLCVACIVQLSCSTCSQYFLFACVGRRFRTLQAANTCNNACNMEAQWMLLTMQKKFLRITFLNAGNLNECLECVFVEFVVGPVSKGVDDDLSAYIPGSNSDLQQPYRKESHQIVFVCGVPFNSESSSMSLPSWGCVADYTSPVLRFH